MLSIMIAAAAGLGVAALILGIAMFFRGSRDDSLEDRLDVLAGLNKKSGALREAEKSLLTNPLDDVPGQLERLMARMGNIRLLLAQANLDMSPSTFWLITLGLAGSGALIALVTRLPIYVVPAVAGCLGVLPLMWVFWKRGRRRSAFAKQLPEAMELMSRALRAGHSLQAGFQLVGDEMHEPIGTEFTKTFEEQNLGVGLEESLEGMTNRIPNLDLKFFATAVVLQRQTGGDLAEILDKIGHLVRERFKIFGQIAALTGEGRLSGIVLLALPPVLFLVMMRLNGEYCMVLFTDPLGKKMLAFAVVMQLLGALVIRKIVNIKV
jgi:tight adherence protein B